MSGPHSKVHWRSSPCCCNYNIDITSLSDMSIWQVYVHSTLTSSKCTYNLHLTESKCTYNLHLTISKCTYTLHIACSKCTYTLHLTGSRCTYNLHLTGSKCTYNLHLTGSKCVHIITTYMWELRLDGNWMYSYIM